jgi:predicted PurR-regulated permease PerM
VALAFAVRFVFSGLLVLMLTAFLVADSERVVTFVHLLAPARDRARFVDLLDRIDRGLSGVVRGQLTICVANGVLTLVGLLLLKVKFAFLMAIVAAVFSLVPIFGSILSTVPIVVVALSSGLTTAVLAVLWIIGIHLLEANLLNPKIMGDAAKIHPVLVVLALVIGEHYYGLPGALFAVPITSICVTIWKAARGRAMVLDEEITAHEDDEARAPPADSDDLPRRARRLRADGG